MNYQEALTKLKSYGQEHVLMYYNELTKEQQEALLTQIDETDFSILVSGKEAASENKKGEISPLTAMQLPEIEAKKEQFQACGLQVIREGKVGAVLLAGGMGTRLGSDEPKGMYNIGITKKVYIFQRLIENLMDVVREAESWIPLYIMTSEKNHEATCKFLYDHDYFGYNSILPCISGELHRRRSQMGWNG